TRFKCDWSSDVCSSDLHKRQEIVGDQRRSCAELCRVCACPGGGGTYRFHSLSSSRQDTRPFSCGAVGRFGTSGQRLCADYAGREIGRASCREGVETSLG